MGFAHRLREREYVPGARKTYEAVPAPKLVIAVGACAIAGGPFVDHPEIHNGTDGTADLFKVDLYIPGARRIR